MRLGWDSYFVEINGRRASLFLDLDPPPDETISRLPHVLFIRLDLLKPGDHGLTTDAEFGALRDLEEALEPLLAQDVGGRYVGRLTHDGARTFLVYVASASPEVSEVIALLADHGYPPELWTEPDAEWSRYRQWLYPSPEELQSIRDRRVIDKLVEAGDMLATPRDVRHWIYFRSDAERAAFLDEAATAGYPTAESLPADDSMLGVCLTTHHPADYGSLAPVVRALFRLAQRCGGEYDGWETEVTEG